MAENFVNIIRDIRGSTNEPATDTSCIYGDIKSMHKEYKGFKQITDEERLKLKNIEEEATKNSTDSFLLSRENHTGNISIADVQDTPSRMAMTIHEKNKLEAINVNATVNDTDANLRNRSTHTGTQSADTIVDGLVNAAFTNAEKVKLAVLDITKPPKHLHHMNEITLGDLDASRITESSAQQFVSSAEKDRISGSEQAVNKGIPHGYAPLDGNGKINPSYLESLNVIDVFTPVDFDAMLLLSSAKPGDIAYVQDDEKTYMLIGLPSNNHLNWKELNSAASVVSVNGLNGVVSMSSDDLPEGTVNKYFTGDRVTNEVKEFIRAGTNVTVSYNPATNELTISADTYAKTEIDTKLAEHNDASGISYDGSSSGLVATKVQGAIDEVESRLDTVGAVVSDLDQMIDTLDNTAVKLTGNQTIAGIKTFTSSPIVPTPTTDNDAVNKKYVDDAIAIDNIDDLATYTGSSLVIIVKDSNRGGIFVSKTEVDMDPNTGSLYTVNGGTVFAKLGGGFWVRQYSGAINVKWFGAKGDGLQDDTVFINNAIALGGGINFPKATYKISNSINYSGNKSIFIDGGGATLNVVSTEISRALYINPSSNIDFCLVKNLKIEGNNVTNCGIYVNTNSFTITDIRIDDNSILNLNNVNNTVSVAGIRVDALNCSTLDITSNFIYNLNRTKVNPGIIATVGIGVYNLNIQANISGNSINGVLGPSGDADADGIQVFSSNRLEEDVRQTSSPIITGNRIQQVKGRFIKLQCSNGKINNNIMENIGLELINDFTGIDAQTGGVLITSNTIRIGAFTGGESLSLFGLQMRSTGDWENIYMVSNNQITIEQNIPYCCILYPATGSNGTVLIESNIIQDHTNTKICTTFAYVGVATNMSKYTIKLNDNIVPLGDGGRLFGFNTVTLGLLVDPITGPLISGILRIHITNNISSLSGNSTDLIYFEKVGGNYPYLQYLTILGNSNFTRNAITAQGMDIKKLPEGTSFYYSTDGTDLGGLINTPAIFNRYVSVETPSVDKVVLSSYNGSSFVSYNKKTGVAYKYIGTVV